MTSRKSILGQFADERVGVSVPHVVEEIVEEAHQRTDRRFDRATDFYRVR